MYYSQTCNFTATSTIPGPYVNPERTESIPLKGTPASSSSFLSRCCNNCLGFADDDAGDGLKFIIVTFFILSAAVTVALVSQIYHGDFQVIPHGSVATDSPNCSVIGTDILKKGGNAVDAAVASTFCMGVVHPHITGLGGGGFILLYDHRRKEVLESVDFRESAPHVVSPPTHETVGPLTVGVPGLVSGLFEVHKAHGKLSWQEVVKPASDVARSGFLVPSSLVAARAQLPPRSGANGILHDFIDPLEAGQSIKRPTLAATLELIAKEGPDVFYNGSVSKEILAAVQGSSLTAADLASYRPVRRETLHESFYGFDIIVPGAPSGGPLLLAALKSISALNLTSGVSEESIPLLLYRQAHAIQQNYASFLAESGDPDYNLPASSGLYSTVHSDTVASHVSAVDLNDLYVSVVSGHNSLFGSQVMTEGGFLLNNALASFDIAATMADKVPAASPISITNTYTVPANSNGSVSRVVYVPNASTEPDHQPAAPLDSPQAPTHLLSEGFGQNFSIPALQQMHQGRSKRFDGTEAGPKATVWGSSVANNGLAGGKRPISFATPIIAVESGQICGRRLVLGGSDAGVAAQVLSQLLVLDGNSISSLEFPRVKLTASGPSLSVGQAYQLNPTRLQQLTDLGIHMQPPSEPNPSVNIVEKVGDVLLSYSDSRGGGLPSRF
ncbi:hypothetical protein ONE63_009747 [Megalurothrips usitatus]|uniref:Glutathione hydrolase 7-like n=1 Tax=Megalurothrips usitatus TaxID=439358 RepID=A0AAV7XJE1_9NEOP|nr:hypothetical protein ONE63_009747 [Megalurothrips usitatus]